jgi:hypothetical protein
MQHAEGTWEIHFSGEIWREETIWRLRHRFFLSDQGLSILSEGPRECVQCTRALERSREGNGEAACTVLYSCAAYITSQQGRVSEVHYRHSLVRRGIHLVRDGVQPRTLMNAVMNLQVLWKTRNFSPSWTTINLSRRTLLKGVWSKKEVRGCD